MNGLGRVSIQYLNCPIMKTELTRRKFLQGAAAVGACLGFPTIVPAAVLGANSPSNQTTVGSIGVGGRGGAILSGAVEVPNARVIGICDTFSHRRENTAKALNQRYGGQY